MFKKIVRTGSYFHLPKLSGQYVCLLFALKNDFSVIFDDKSCLPFKKIFYSQFTVVLTFTGLQVYTLVY